MPNYTLTYSQGVQGWPSFYSYEPHWMIGMNNFFYTFGTEKDPITGNPITGGNIYRHNSNTEGRNTFYGFRYKSQLISVFNDLPLQNKLFKTINLESDNPWSATLETDIQTSETIDYTWFEKKEASWFAFVRNTTASPADVSEYALRSLNGIGRSTAITGPAAALVVDFSISPLISIGSIISVGDGFYYSLPPTYETPVFMGNVVAVNIDLPAGINQVVVDTTVAGGSIPAISDPYCFYIKNGTAESHGVLGHYCQFTIELPTSVSSVATELFAVESSIMKSFP